MIDVTDIRENYHNRAIKITLKNGIVLHGVIVDNTAGYYRFVKKPNLDRYKSTKDDSLVEKVYFKDMKSIDY
ncbi:MAG: hypothetical protein KAS29_17335 [Bacteroidales bacterium]|jgi:hypothetical protein|nr:hypothetical protein [Bacteroidales bacterium]